MDYTREPIIESVITSREGCKLVIRSSKGMSQEEYFMDAVEIVTFGKAQFFRSLEKPKPFLLPITDYEVVEVREPRMVLKNVGVDRSVKIASEKKPPQPQQPPRQVRTDPEPQEEKQGEDKKRQKRSDRRRRGGKNQPESETEEVALPTQATEEEGVAKAIVAAPSPSALSALLAPPTTLISETLTRYRRDEAFKQAFYEKEESEGPVQEAILSDEEFDEGDHIIFRGHEPVSDFNKQPFEAVPESEEAAQQQFFEANQEDEEAIPLPFEEEEDHP